MTTDTEEAGRIAESLGYFTEAQFAAFAGITAGTAEAWRHRGKGPAHVRLGKQILYPREAVSEYLREHVRARGATPARELL